MKLIKAGLLAMALACGTAWADCDNTSNQRILNACAQADMQAADKRLLAFYEQYLQTLEPQVAKEVRAAQRLWVQFKEKDCQAVGSEYAGGSMQPMIIASCLAAHADARTKDFAERLAEHD